MSTPKAVLDQLQTQITSFTPASGPRAGQPLGAYFKDATQAEFPYCTDFPALHINYAGETGDAMGAGGGLATRDITIDISVTVSEADVADASGVIATVVEDVRDAIRSDRTLGGLLNLAVVDLPVSRVPSPVGSAYVGTRRITVMARITQPLIL